MRNYLCFAILANLVVFFKRKFIRPIFGAFFKNYRSNHSSTFNNHSFLSYTVGNEFNLNFEVYVSMRTMLIVRNNH